MQKGNEYSQHPQTGSNYICYTRCSTDEQKTQGISHEYQAQGVRISGAVKVGAFHEVAYFEDTTTGTSFLNRPGLDQALDLCKKMRGKIDFLLVYRWDRLGRDVSECFNCLKRFREVGVEVNCPDRWMDFENPSFPILLALEFGQAQSESMKISERTKDGIRRWLEMGYWPRGHLPIGYVRTGVPDGTDAKQVRGCEPDSALEPVILAMFENYANGEPKHVLYKQYSEKLGIKKNQFNRIFQNEFYAGLITVPAYKKTPETVIHGRHRAIVPMALWQKCQEVYQQMANGMKGKTYTQQAIADNIDEIYLKGVLMCPVTGRPMTAYKSKGKSGKTWTYYDSPKEKGQIIRADLAHAIMLEAMATFVVDDATMAEVRAEAHRQTNAKMQALNTALNTETAAAERAATRLANIANLLADGVLDPAEYKPLKAKYTDDQAAALLAIQQITAEIEGHDNFVLQVIDLVQNLPQLYQQASPRDKSRLLRAVFPSGLEINKQTKRVRTPEINSIILSICSKSMRYTMIEIKKDAGFDASTLWGGSPPPFRTPHIHLLRQIFAA